MQTDIKFLELPIKYAFVALLVFVSSGLALRYMYEFSALTAMNLYSTKPSWVEIQNIVGLSFAESLRFMFFYFLISLSLVCYARSPATLAPWGPILLFVVIPLAAGIIPCLFSSEEYAFRPHWSALSYVFSLMFLGVGHKNGTKFQRLFLAVFVLLCVAPRILAEASLWIQEMEKATLILYGKAEFEKAILQSLYYYFAPVAAFRLFVEIYLFYKMPSNFMKDLSKAGYLHKDLPQN